MTIFMVGPSVTAYRCYNNSNPIKKNLYFLDHRFFDMIKNHSSKRLEEYEKQMITRTRTRLDQILYSGILNQVDPLNPNSIDFVHLNALMLAFSCQAWDAATFIANKYPNLCTEAVSTKFCPKCPLELTITNILHYVKQRGPLSNEMKTLFGRVFMEHRKSNLHLEIKSQLYRLTESVWLTENLSPITRACFTYPNYKKEISRIALGIFPNELVSIIQEYNSNDEPSNEEEYRMLANERISIHGILPEINVKIDSLLKFNLLEDAIRKNNEIAVKLFIDLGANPLVPLNGSTLERRTILDYARAERPNLVSSLEVGIQVSGSINGDERGS